MAGFDLGIGKIKKRAMGGPGGGNDCRWKEWRISLQVVGGCFFEEENGRD